MLSALLSVFHNTIAFAAPLALPAMGGFTSERSGVINIALEGKMLTSACIAFFCTYFWHNAWLGLMMAIATGISLSILHWLLTQIYRIDQIISGMAINALALGTTNYL